MTEQEKSYKAPNRNKFSLIRFKVWRANFTVTDKLREFITPEYSDVRREIPAGTVAFGVLRREFYPRCTYKSFSIYALGAN